MIDTDTANVLAPILEALTAMGPSGMPVSAWNAIATAQEAYTTGTTRPPQTNTTEPAASASVTAVTPPPPSQGTGAAAGIVL